jgi:protein O-GlcNAc transferase
MAGSLPSIRDDAIVAEAADYAAKFHKLGMIAEAEKFYSAILEAKPDHFEALHLLGVLRQQQGNAIEALRLIGAALDTNARSADSLRSFGAVLDSLDRHEAAVAVHDKILALKEERCEALVSLGNALLHLGRTQEALAEFDGVRTNRGVALVQLGRAREALDVFDAVLAANERHPDVLVSRGVALLHLGRIRDALACFDKAIEIKPDDPFALSNRLMVLTALGSRDEVLEACDRILAVNPSEAIRFGPSTGSKRRSKASSRLGPSATRGHSACSHSFD